MTTRIAVLASGGGSNLAAVHSHLSALGSASPAHIALVLSDRATAGALARARAWGIEALSLNVEERTTGLDAILGAHRIDLVVLAGYLRKVPDAVVERFSGGRGLVNVHPSLLPAFGGPGMYGRHVHEAAVARGVRVTGATVHFVDAVYDHGPIIAQWPIAVGAAETAESVASRVLAIEHRLFPRVVSAVAAGEVRLKDDGRVTGWSMDAALEAALEAASQVLIDTTNGAPPQ